MVGEKWVGLRTVEVTVELMDVGEREEGKGKRVMSQIQGRIT